MSSGLLMILDRCSEACVHQSLYIWSVCGNQRILLHLTVGPCFILTLLVHVLDCFLNVITLVPLDWFLPKHLDLWLHNQNTLLSPIFFKLLQRRTRFGRVVFDGTLYLYLGLLIQFVKHTDLF